MFFHMLTIFGIGRAVMCVASSLPNINKYSYNIGGNVTEELSPYMMRIVGGETVTRNDTPWMTAIYKQNGLSCGGTLIHRDWVLTAAHCVDDISIPPNNSSVSSLSDTATLFLGGIDRSNLSTLEAHAICMCSKAQVVLYPQFNNPSKFDNDIALLRLMTPSCMPPVVLSRNDSNIGPGNQTVVLGWGVLEEGGRTLPAALQRATIPIVEKTKCTQRMNNERVHIVNSMICAGDDQGGKDSCAGDSGGPLLIEKNESFVQIGVVSFGLGCARPHEYGIYTNVSYYIDWIEEHTGKLPSPDHMTLPDSSTSSIENTNNTGLQNTTELRCGSDVTVVPISADGLSLFDILWNTIMDIFH